MVDMSSRVPTPWGTVEVVDGGHDVPSRVMCLGDQVVRCSRTALLQLLTAELVQQLAQ